MKHVKGSTRAGTPHPSWKRKFSDSQGTEKKEIGFIVPWNVAGIYFLSKKSDFQLATVDGSEILHLSHFFVPGFKHTSEIIARMSSNNRVNVKRNM